MLIDKRGVIAYHSLAYGGLNFLSVEYLLDQQPETGTEVAQASTTCVGLQVACCVV